VYDYLVPLPRSQVGVLVRVAAKEDLAAAEKLSNSGGFVVMDCAAEAWKVGFDGS
jgi:hypothetical protein